MRIGIGYDIHRLVEKRDLFLGGVQIPYIKGLLAHSDGDCLLHAICDAFLGAIGEGDIGRLFPEHDTAYDNIRSTELLMKVNKILQDKGYKISNIDSVVIAQEPRLEPFKNIMSEKIADLLGIQSSCVNVKATTNEGVDGLGKSEAIAAYAVVLLDGGK